MPRRVLIAFPTAWDERQLGALRPEVRAAHEFLFDTPHDDDVRWDYDVLGYVDERARGWRGRLDAVLSSSDYPGASAAAALARELGLPGPPPEAVLLAAHKYHSRQRQGAVAPEAVPRFALVDPLDRRTWPAAADLPCFLKPVKGSFSLFARRVDDERAVARLLESPALLDYRTHYVQLFDRLARRYRPCEHGAGWFLAEELLCGDQVTVEGWVSRGAARVLGIVDTSFHPGTTSFSRFDYPSALPQALQERMGDVACRVALALGLDDTLFNVEMFHDPETGRVSLIEVNPRLCGQFADLYEKVDGTNGFEVALALACGEEPVVERRRGRFGAAASVPLRVFESVRLVRAPEPERVRAVEARHPGSLIWSECRSGDLLAVAPDVEDGQSLRFGVINLGASTRSDIEGEAAAIAGELGFEFRSLAATGQAGPR